MSRWAIANMNSGELEGSRILAEPSYELLWTPALESVRVSGDNRPVHIGLSWFLSEKEGNQIVSHGGRDTGYRANFVMYPEAGGAIIILSNYSDQDDSFDKVTSLAAKVAIGSEG
jgi:CubicO group peptidase (beta-lactamase class C family)